MTYLSIKNITLGIPFPLFVLFTWFSASSRVSRVRLPVIMVGSRPFAPSFLSKICSHEVSSCVLLRQKILKNYVLSSTFPRYWCKIHMLYSIWTQSDPKKVNDLPGKCLKGEIKGLLAQASGCIVARAVRLLTANFYSCHKAILWRKCELMFDRKWCREVMCDSTDVFKHVLNLPGVDVLMLTSFLS